MYQFGSFIHTQVCVFSLTYLNPFERSTLSLGALQLRETEAGLWEEEEQGAVWCGSADMEHSSVVLRGSRTLVRGCHVVQVAAVLMPTVVQGLTLEKGWGRGQVGDWGRGQVVVGVRWGVLGRV